MVLSIPAAAASVAVSALGDSIRSSTVPRNVASLHCSFDMTALTPTGADADTATAATVTATVVALESKPRVARLLPAPVPARRYG